jgi:hypothetical protein
LLSVKLPQFVGKDKDNVLAKLHVIELALTTHNVPDHLKVTNVVPLRTDDGPSTSRYMRKVDTFLYGQSFHRPGSNAMRTQQLGGNCCSVKYEIFDISVIQGWQISVANSGKQNHMYMI